MGSGIKTMKESGCQRYRYRSGKKLYHCQRAAGSIDPAALWGRRNIFHEISFPLPFLCSVCTSLKRAGHRKTRSCALEKNTKRMYTDSVRQKLTGQESFMLLVIYILITALLFMFGKGFGSVFCRYFSRACPYEYREQI